MFFLFPVFAERAGGVTSEVKQLADFRFREFHFLQIRSLFGSDPLRTDVFAVDLEGTLNAERIRTRPRPVIQIFNISSPREAIHVFHISSVSSFRVPELWDLAVKAG